MPRRVSCPVNRTGVPAKQQRSERQRFRHSVIHGALAMPHFGALLEQLFHFRMDRKIRRIAGQQIRNLSELLGRDSRVHFIGAVVAAALVWRPIRGQPAQARLFLHFARGLVRALQFVAHGRDRRRRIRSNLFRVNLPELRVILDFCVQQRLRDGRVIHFAVAVAAVSDQSITTSLPNAERYSSAICPTRTTASGSSPFT